MEKRGPKKEAGMLDWVSRGRKKSSGSLIGIVGKRKQRAELFGGCDL